MTEPGTTIKTEYRSTATFEPPTMHSSDPVAGDIFVASIPDPEQVQWFADHPEDAEGVVSIPTASLFMTEAQAMVHYDMSAEGIRAAFGPPLPAGAVWNEPVWSFSQMEHVYTDYIRPIFQKLHLEPQTDADDFFYNVKGTERPLSQGEQERLAFVLAVQDRQNANGSEDAL